MKIDFSNAKVGDSVFSFQTGITKISAIKQLEGTTYPIICGDYVCSLEGMGLIRDNYASFFHSIEEAQAYLIWIEEENKPKKRYWLWNLVDYTTRDSFISRRLLDEQGFDEFGIRLANWEDYGKVKIETVFKDA